MMWNKDYQACFLTATCGSSLLAHSKCNPAIAMDAAMAGRGEICLTVTAES